MGVIEWVVKMDLCILELVVELNTDALVEGMIQWVV